MILTAIVQTKDGTLVVDLPRDRIDLEMKIRSVGIERLSDQIHIIDDEEKSDISVKLFGESDIGRHLSLLFNENYTLFDVNKTMQFVANSVEDIRDDLEMNIIHDQYDSPAELVGDIERMTDEVGQYTETFYFPLVGNMEDDDDGEQYEVGNRYLRYYEYEIRELLQKEQDLDGTNMKDYFYDDDNAQKKMVSCQWDISNPPFGIDWKREKAAVEAEHKKGELGRFAPGLPKISDGQQLFLLNGLSKMAPDGKMAIIQNGSPLFSGDAESVPSEIRRYVLENDWLDAIVQLSTDQFMNTGISTYIWVCSKNKPAYRAGKVQLIDASHCYEARRKSIGTKRNDITDLCRRLIVQAYGEFKNDAVYGDKNGVYCHSKIFNSEEFGYYKITVERPQRGENGEITTKKGKPVADTKLRDTENVPMTDDIQAYFEREVLPYAPDAWIDEKKTKTGYEIPMTRYFYEYQPPEPVESIVERINALEKDIALSLNALFNREG